MGRNTHTISPAWYCALNMSLFFFFPISLINSIADGPQRYHPILPILWTLRIFRLSPVHALRVFITMRVQHSYNSSTNGKNRTHDFRTTMCAGYLPMVIQSNRSRETGSAVPSRASLLISILRLNLVLTYGIPSEVRGGIHLILNRHTPSDQPRV